MLSDSPVTAVVAVENIERAKEFYGGTLGLEGEPGDEPDGIHYRCGGGTRILVYQSGYAGTNQATAAGWEVDDLAGTIADLESKGITFEEYDDIPGVTREGAIHRSGNLSGAWFKDPDGNILALSQA